MKGRKTGGKGGSGKYIEALKWKTLRKGVKLLEIVSHVSNKGLIVSLQNGLKGTVSKLEASDVFYVHTKGRVREAKGRRPHIPLLKTNSVVVVVVVAVTKVAVMKRKRKMEAQKERLV